MKTTVEIGKDLFARSREVARREGTTLRALIEEGLRAALEIQRDLDRNSARGEPPSPRAGATGR